MKFLISFILLISMGCTQQGSSGEKPSPVVREPQNDPGSNSPGSKICLSDKIVEILRDRKNILSKLSDKTNSMVIWDYQNQHVKMKFSDIKNYHQISPSGEFLLRKVSEQRYLIDHLSENSSYQEPLLYLGKVHSVNFSLKSDFIIGSYRTRGNTDRIHVFDLIKRENVFENTLKNVKYTQMIDDENLFVVAGFGISNILYYYNISSGKSKWFKLKSGELNWFGVSNNILLTKIDHHYYAYDLATEELKYQIDLRTIYDYDYDTDLALVAQDKTNKINVMNLLTGEMLFEVNKPDNVSLASCRFAATRFEISCLSTQESNKLIVWNLEGNTTKQICY